VSGASELERGITHWLRDGEARAEAGRQARGVVERNLGAAERSLRILERLLA
jgi:hypothetical protein